MKKKIYPKLDQFPKCPIDKSPCDKFDMDGYLRESCTDCDRKYNGVRATGGMPVLESIINQFKKLKK